MARMLLRSQSLKRGRSESESSLQSLEDTWPPLKKSPSKIMKILTLDRQDTQQKQQNDHQKNASTLSLDKTWPPTFKRSPSIRLRKILTLDRKKPKRQVVLSDYERTWTLKQTLPAMFHSVAVCKKTGEIYAAGHKIITSFDHHLRQHNIFPTRANTAALCINSKENLILADLNGYRIFTYTKRGKLLKTGLDSLRFKILKGVDCDAYDNIYVSDLDGIRVINSNFQSVALIENHIFSHNPFRASVDRVYVPGITCVQVYNSRGEKLDSIMLSQCQMSAFFVNFDGSMIMSELIPHQKRYELSYARDGSDVKQLKLDKMVRFSAVSDIHKLPNGDLVIGNPEGGQIYIYG